MGGAEWHWWNYLGVTLGLFLMFLSAYPLWPRAMRAVGGGGLSVDWDAVAKVGCVLLIGGALIFVIYAVFVQETPKEVWRHPTIPLAEHPKVAAECRMLAYAAIGAAARDAHDRARYVEDCMTARGFELVPEDG